jgi:hypothetical protein
MEMRADLSRLLENRDLNGRLKAINPRLEERCIMNL